MPELALVTRRGFVEGAVTGVAAGALSAAVHAEDPDKSKKINVVVWDEQQPAQKEAYPNFLGNWIAKYLEAQPGLSVKSVKLDDPQQGLADDVMRGCQVLIWWGHVRNGEIKPETARPLIDRIKAGALSLIALHSAHWSTPFVEAMNERTRLDVAKTFPAIDGERVDVNYIAPAPRYTVPKADARLTPVVVPRKFPDGTTRLTVHLPICCFPAYRADGKPSRVKILKPMHPIVRDVPAEFTLPHTEMYDEPFHIPEPDEVILEERWANGEWFRSGIVWQLGKGRVVYLRPGHETFAVYKEKPMLQILDNAVRWLGRE